MIVRVICQRRVSRLAGMSVDQRQEDGEERGDEDGDALLVLAFREGVRHGKHEATEVRYQTDHL